MTRASIFFDKLGVYSFDLTTKTLKIVDKKVKVTTYYRVTWHCKHGGRTEIEQEITKEEYEFLLRELENDRQREN